MSITADAVTANAAVLLGRRCAATSATTRRSSPSHPPDACQSGYDRLRTAQQMLRTPMRQSQARCGGRPLPEAWWPLHIRPCSVPCRLENCGTCRQSSHPCKLEGGLKSKQHRKQFACGSQPIRGCRFVINRQQLMPASSQGPALQVHSPVPSTASLHQGGNLCGIDHCRVRRCASCGAPRLRRCWTPWRR